LIGQTESESSSSASRLLKYPTIFNSADVALITKVDLVAAVEFNAVVANRDIQTVLPGMIVLEVSAKPGGGMEAFLDFSHSRRDATRVGVASQGAKAFAASD
jgi:hydrogenase nickel incorporation protein HypB